VSWNDAQAFIAALNTLTAMTFRLPSEAEWEYACRAGTATRFYWGDDLTYTAIGGYAWYWGNCSSEMYAHIVGQKLQNTWDLFDVNGNVWEWCQDWYHADYTGAPTDGSAWESPTGTERVARGGGWGDNGNNCRSAMRGSEPPTSSYHSVGFRVAR
jgi:formylglycine-generating enzyme required for sulfatase activity